MLPIRPEKGIRAVRRDQDHLFVDATPCRVLGVPSLTQDVDPDSACRYGRRVEIEKGVVWRGAGIGYLEQGFGREFVAKLTVAYMQMADRAGRFELSPVGTRKSIDVKRGARLWSAENPSAARDNAPAAHDRIAHQY